MTTQSTASNRVVKIEENRGYKICTQTGYENESPTYSLAMIVNARQGIDHPNAVLVKMKTYKTMKAAIKSGDTFLKQG